MVASKNALLYAKLTIVFYPNLPFYPRKWEGVIYAFVFSLWSWKKWYIRLPHLCVLQTYLLVTDQW